MSFSFSCPVCGDILFKADGSFKCENGHCFDIAKQGYVNLLCSQSSSLKRHGDDKLMVYSRTSFLDKGYYNCLMDRINERIGERTFDSMKFIDLGCGECSYTMRIAKEYPEIDIGGVDISKQALISGGKRCCDISLAVASVFNLPVVDGYCDGAMTVFSPHCVDEIKRILKSGGFWLNAYPLERHLMGLKSIVYDKPYLNEVNRDIPDGFNLLSRDEIRDIIRLKCNEDILNLFRMTPYYYKTSASDQEKIETVDSLITEIEFGIDVYVKA